MGRCGVEGRGRSRKMSERLEKRRENGDEGRERRRRAEDKGGRRKIGWDKREKIERRVMGGRGMQGRRKRRRRRKGTGRGNDGTNREKRRKIWRAEKQMGESWGERDYSLSGGGHKYLSAERVAELLHSKPQTSTSVVWTHILTSFTDITGLWLMIKCSSWLIMLAGRVEFVYYTKTLKCCQGFFSVSQIYVRFLVKDNV